MPDKRQHITINAELIRRYLAGELDDKTMHALERQALDDPFLAEALEGYAAHEPDQSAHLADLQNRLEQRVPATAKVRPLYYRWAAAAVVFLLVGLSAVWIWRQQLPSRKDIAKVETTRYDTVHSAPQQPSATADSAVAKDVAAIKKEAPKVQPPVPGKQPAKGAHEKTTDQKAAGQEMARLKTRDRKTAVPETLRETSPALAAAPAFDSSRKGNNLAEVLVVGYGRMAKKELAASSRMVIVPPAANIRVLEGKVVDKEDSNGLAGVMVTADQTRQTTYTDSQGNFALAVDSTKANDLKLSAAGYDPGVLNVKQYKRNVEVALQPSTGLATAVVITAGNARPQRGLAHYRQYIATHIRYPDAARQQGIKGVVRISFDVLPGSTLSDLKVVQQLHPDCDAEALRLVREGPVWLPAPVGKAAHVTISIPFNP